MGLLQKFRGFIYIYCKLPLDLSSIECPFDSYSDLRDSILCIM